MGTNKTRHLKIEWLEDTILSFFKSKKNEAISKDKLIAQFCLKFNSTERTAKEMLKIFVSLGIIKIDGDNIWKA